MAEQASEHLEIMNTLLLSWLISHHQGLPEPGMGSNGNKRIKQRNTWQSRRQNTLRLRYFVCLLRHDYQQLAGSHQSRILLIIRCRFHSNLHCHNRMLDWNLSTDACSA